MFQSVMDNDLPKLEELVIKLVISGKSQLAILLYLILKIGDGCLKEICINQDGHSKTVQ